MPQIPLPDGSVGDAVELDYEVVREDWNEYELEDGTRLKVKIVLQKVLRSDDAHTAMGEPIYQFSSQNAVRTENIPEELMAEPEVDVEEVD